MNTSYPFPTRNVSFTDNDCFYIAPNHTDFDALKANYERKISIEAINLKLQYFSIERDLINSFHYVNPVLENLPTSSVKFATIIRESSNLFEQIARIIYNKLFVVTGSINIYNYLSLDRFLDFQNSKLHCPILQNLALNKPFILNPFYEMSTWDKNSEIEDVSIPKWWTAYNKIKHSPTELTDYSILENAVRSLLASYLIISKYLGPGVVSGSLEKPEKNGAEIINRHLTVEESGLFMRSDHLFGYVI
jgi:hypothetical protein